MFGKRTMFLNFISEIVKSNLFRLSDFRDLRGGEISVWLGGSKQASTMCIDIILVSLHTKR